MKKLVAYLCLSIMIVFFSGVAKSQHVSQSNTIQVVHYKVEISSDYKFVGKLDTEDTVPGWSRPGTSFQTTTEHHLFIKTNDSGKVESFVIVRSQRLAGNTPWATEPDYSYYKNIIHKGDIEILGLQTKVVVTRVSRPHNRYIDLMKTNGLEIDESYPNLIAYVFGKNASKQVKLEILYYQGERIVDDVQANDNLSNAGKVVKLSL
jgi:hypothetical protein